MFAEWERYARAFSALGICAENGSRAAVCGVIAAEPLFALFGLNMTGAEVSLFPNQLFRPNGMWKDMLAKEKVTDLIVSDILVTPQIREEIEAAKEELGLRSVIYVHSRLGGPTVGPAELTYNEYNYHLLKGRAGSVFMNDLIVQHADAPIRYDESAGDRTAFSVLSPDAAQGARRPLRLTDRMFNDMLNRLPKGYHPFAKGADAAKPFRVVQSFDFGSGFSLLAQTVSTLAAGDTLVTTFFGAAHPKFLRAIGYYYVSVMTVTGPVMDSWLAGGACGGIRLSSLQVVGMCGEEAEPGKMEAYQRFLEDRGCRCGILPAGEMIGAQGKKLPGFEDGPGAACVQGENGPACSVFDLLRTAGPAKKPAGFSLPDPFGLIRKTVPDKGEEKKEFQIPEGLRAAFMKYGNRLSGIMNGRKWMNFDFEE